MLIINVPARIVNEQAYHLGQLDAQLGNICTPEMYYRRPSDKTDFCLGYESIAGQTLTTTLFLGSVR